VIASWAATGSCPGARRQLRRARAAGTIAFDARHLDRIPVRIGVAGGPGKIRPILGALRGGLITTLVTDQRTAELVVDLDDTGRAA